MERDAALAGEVVDELLRSDLKDPLAPRRLEVTTLVADMQGYTSQVESLSLEDPADQEGESDVAAERPRLLHLTAEVQLQSDKDLLGAAFQRMIGTLRRMAGVAEAIAGGDLREDVPEDDPLGWLAGAHRGVVIRYARLVLRPARRPTGLFSTLRAPLRAAEPGTPGSAGWSASTTAWGRHRWPTGTTTAST